MVDLPGARLSRAEQVQLTRERLLAAADDVFARRGFFAATFEEISALAGCTRAAVYKHFPTKEALFAAFVEAEAGRRLTALESALNQQGADATILSTFGAALAAAMSGPGRWRVAVMEYEGLLVEEVAEHPEAREALMASERYWEDRIGGLLARLCQSLGVELPLPLEELTTVVCALGIGFGAFSKYQPDLDVGRLFTDVLNVLLSGGPPSLASADPSQHREVEQVDEDGAPTRKVRT